MCCGPWPTAWWDYGYQINGVANRTTIADGMALH
jgi:asparagine N-glycosylation enzyme membrane subunit Stt3